MQLIQSESQKAYTQSTIHSTRYLPSPFPAPLEGVNPFRIIPAPAPASVLSRKCARGVVAATSACVPGVTSEKSSGIGRLREPVSGDGLDGSAGLVGSGTDCALKIGSGRKAARPVVVVVRAKSGRGLRVGDRGGLFAPVDDVNREPVANDKEPVPDPEPAADAEKTEVALEFVEAANKELVPVLEELVDAPEATR